MDSFQIPSAQTTPAVPQVAPMMPAVQQQAMPEVKKGPGDIIKIVAIVILALTTVTFLSLFVWMSMQYNDAKSDVDGQIAVAVAEAKDAQATELEAEFAEREKYPYRTFSGPADYGQLTFEYPKTWSVYVEKAANAGGDFVAYMNPVQVDAVGKDTINALRITIEDKSFELVTEEYQKLMDKKDSGLSMSSVTIGKNENITANLYTGKIPNTDLNGMIAIFKIRDKAVILQTDSVLFEADYNRVLSTITFNE